MEQKTCPRCRTKKSRDDFNRNRSTKDGLADWCRECTRRYQHERRAWFREYEQRPGAKETKQRYRAEHPESVARGKWKYRLKSKYGLTLEEFGQMVKAQDGKCALCGDTPPRLWVDHDHLTGEVRGLLCPKCNVGLGQLGDTSAGLLSALEYLTGSRWVEAKDAEFAYQ